MLFKSQILVRYGKTRTYLLFNPFSFCFYPTSSAENTLLVGGYSRNLSTHIDATPSYGMRFIMLLDDRIQSLHFMEVGIRCELDDNPIVRGAWRDAAGKWAVGVAVYYNLGRGLFVLAMAQERQEAACVVAVPMRCDDTGDLGGRDVHRLNVADEGEAVGAGVEEGEFGLRYVVDLGFLDGLDLAFVKTKALTMRAEKPCAPGRSGYACDDKTEEDSPTYHSSSCQSPKSLYS